MVFPPSPFLWNLWEVSKGTQISPQGPCGHSYFHGWHSSLCRDPRGAMPMSIERASNSERLGRSSTRKNVNWEQISNMFWALSGLLLKQPGGCHTSAQWPAKGWQSAGVGSSPGLGFHKCQKAVDRGTYTSLLWCYKMNLCEGWQQQLGAGRRPPSGPHTVLSHPARYRGEKVTDQECLTAVWMCNNFSIYFGLWLNWTLK